MNLCDSLLHLYQGSREHDATRFPGFALALVESLLAFDSALWAVGAGDGDLRSVYRLRQDPAFLRAWRRQAPRDPQVRVLIEGKPDHTVRFSDLPEMVSSGALHNLCAHFGIRHVLCATAPDGVTGLAHHLCCYRGPAAIAFSEKERRLARFLVPHLVEARRNNLVAHFASCREGAYRSAFCDHTGLLHHAECGFLALLRGEWPDFGAGQVPASLLKSLTGHNAVFEGTSVIVKARRAGDLIHLQMRREVRMRRLSPRERLITKHLVCGATYKQIGQRLGISASTVTKHANSIYRKTAVRNKTQLADFFKEWGSRSE